MHKNSSEAGSTDYAEHQEIYIKQLRERLVAGETVHVQLEYNIVIGRVVRLSAKSATVHFPAQGCYSEYTRATPYQKIAKRGDRVVLVWETWKGTNGRGGYRLEGSAYESVRLPVEEIAHQSYLQEDVFLGATSDQQQRYLDSAANIVRNRAHLTALLTQLS